MPSQFPAFRLTVAALMDERRARFVANLKRERRLRGLSPLEAAFAAGIDKRTYERWEAGETEPQIKKLKALADYWGLQVRDLLPDPEAEQRELRDQLDRMEATLYDLSVLFRATLPTTPSPARDLAEALERIAERDRQRRDTPAEGQDDQRRRQA